MATERLLILRRRMWGFSAPHQKLFPNQKAEENRLIGVSATHQRLRCAVIGRPTHVFTWAGARFHALFQ